MLVPYFCLLCWVYIQHVAKEIAARDVAANGLGLRIVS